MSKTLARRLDVLTKRYVSQPEPTPALDLSALTLEERFELDSVLTQLEGAPQRPNGWPDLSPLADAELERLHALAERITAQETP